MRRAVGGLLVVLIVVLLGIVVKGCSDSRAKTALSDYNSKVTAIGSESHGTSQQFFKLFNGDQPAAQQLQSSINQLISASNATLTEAEKLNVPDAMVPAQQSLLIALQLRRDALTGIGQNIRTALGDSGQQADDAIAKIRGQMAALNASDVLFQARIDPFIQDALKKKGVAGNVINSEFLPDVNWMSTEYIATKLDQQLTSGGGGGAAGGGSKTQQTTGPGLHGTGLNATSAGDQVLSPTAANNITYTPGMIFFVSFTNQGDNDEFNINVTLRIESESSSPITLTGKVATAPKGVKQTVQLKLNRTPPLNTAATIRVTVAAVPGEKKTDNNKSSYPVLFKRG
jgi:hypothetical protein